MKCWVGRLFEKGNINASIIRNWIVWLSRQNLHSVFFGDCKKWCRRCFFFILNLLRRSNSIHLLTYFLKVSWKPKRSKSIQNSRIFQKPYKKTFNSTQFVRQSSFEDLFYHDFVWGWYFKWKWLMVWVFYIEIAISSVSKG